jgi:endoglycosylceramidase
LWRHGVYSLLDSHQDFYNKRYAGGGDGAPDWAVIDHSLPADPAHTTGTAAWQSFWDNAKASDGVGLQDHFVGMWRHVAQRFRGLPGVMGIDIINEPPPGSPRGVHVGAIASGAESTDEQVACLRPLLGCPEFDSDSLAPFYGRVIRAIRQVDAKTIINYEPNGTWQFGVIPSWIGHLGDPNLAFSYHPYISETQSTVWGPASAAAPGALPPSEDEYAQEIADRNDAPAWIGEIGAGIPLGDLADADRTMQGYLYWTFWSTNPADAGTDTSSTILDPKKPPTGSNINQQDVTSYVRPYPMATAGTPTGWHFDTSSKAFTFTFSTRQPDGRTGRGTTDVYLPKSVYASGYAISLRGATVAGTSLGGQELRLRADPGAATVSLTVSAT